MTLKSGDKVFFHNCREAEKYKGEIFEVTSDERPLNKKTNKTVVNLDGIRGNFSPRYLIKVK